MSGRADPKTKPQPDSLSPSHYIYNTGNTVGFILFSTSILSLDTWWFVNKRKVYTWTLVWYPMPLQYFNALSIDAFHMYGYRYPMAILQADGIPIPTSAK